MLYLVGSVLAAFVGVILLQANKQKVQNKVVVERPRPSALEILLAVTALLVAGFSVTSYVGFLHGWDAKVLAIITMVGASQAFVGIAGAIGLLFRRRTILALYVPSSLVILSGLILFVLAVVLGLGNL